MHSLTYALTLPIHSHPRILASTDTRVYIHTRACCLCSDEYPVCEIFDDGTVSCWSDNFKEMGSAAASRIFSLIDEESLRYRNRPMKPKSVERLVKVIKPIDFFRLDCAVFVAAAPSLIDHMN